MPNERTFVAGHMGMIGSALLRVLKEREWGAEQIVTAPRHELDLEDKSRLDAWLDLHRPDIIVIAAALVGGIKANRQYPTEFLLSNLKIQNNLMEWAWKRNIKRICFLGSSCMYPTNCAQPFKEESLLQGPFETTNLSYALAKTTGLQLCESLRAQYGTSAVTIIPNNSYGPGDKYDQERGHVIPSIIDKIQTAKDACSSRIECWGTGAIWREFIYADDVASAIATVLERDESELKHSVFNVSTSEEIQIKTAVEIIAEEMQFDGVITWDTTRPDGVRKKGLDISRISELGWKPLVSFRAGIKKTISAYKSSRNISH